MGIDWENLDADPWDEYQRDEQAKKLRKDGVVRPAGLRPAAIDSREEDAQRAAEALSSGMDASRLDGPPDTDEDRALDNAAQNAAFGMASKEDLALLRQDTVRCRRMLWRVSGVLVSALLTRLAKDANWMPVLKRSRKNSGKF